MLQRRLSPNAELLQTVSDAMTQANLHYLCHCVSFWLAVKPDCGVKEWLDYSIRRSTHRLASDGLQDMIARLSDDDLLWIHETRSQRSEIRDQRSAISPLTPAPDS